MQSSTRVLAYKDQERFQFGNLLRWASDIAGGDEGSCTLDDLQRLVEVLKIDLEQCIQNWKEVVDAKDIVELSLGRKLVEFLGNKGIHTIGELRKKSASDLLQLREGRERFGNDELREIRTALKRLGLFLFFEEDLVAEDLWRLLFNKCIQK